MLYRGTQSGSSDALTRYLFRLQSFRERQHTRERKDVDSRITTQIVGHLEKAVRPWIRCWNVEPAAGGITRLLRHHGQPYSAINVLSLWVSALGQNFTFSWEPGRTLPFGNPW